MDLQDVIDKALGLLDRSPGSTVRFACPNDHELGTLIRLRNGDWACHYWGIPAPKTVCNGNNSGRNDPRAVIAKGLS